ncbi:uroporphyrinogen decarboxylase family protein [Leadbettera azotonutricia]|uniref:Putative methylcobalamin:Coenzyme M methyltransferase n=1 Tax=Leadbettera azotonutricia (strain ATCC BAA-888 / DSM 13862 / ZAS-9) TaxID=545695 RepID=F5YEN5_LEAAZ|nr:uroporphyrinogen decarboxylase family protein [Leadbettera azotonutricia]AEF81003.1 putative methylcobalamin:Coenzyme M methyltransferase [Leadbettera azotonutricia ZAS-9]
MRIDIPVEKNIFDLNAYCSGHITGSRNPTDLDTHSGIDAFPYNFVTEALALGATTEKTAGGFETLQYLFSDPDDLLNLPLMDEQPPVIHLLEMIEKAPPEKIILLKVNGPYSILASLISPHLFYRWLAKNKVQVHAALERINTGLVSYILKAAAKGVKILSLADPYANPEILGEKHYREFAASYLVKLLKEITNKTPGLVIHLCPHNSLILEKYGFLKSRAEYTAAVPPVQTKTEALASDESYINLLIALTLLKNSVLLGHQCIYSEKPFSYKYLLLSG